MIFVDKKTNLSKYVDVHIVDITNTSDRNNYARLSPFYPHGGIPAPNSYNEYFESVYSVWQALCIKTVERIGAHFSKFRKFKKGINSTEYWDIKEARNKILVPIYCWMLENKAFDLIFKLREVKSKTNILIIDVTTNDKIDNVEESFSCGTLLKAYIEGAGPYKNAIKDCVVWRCVMVGRKDYYKKESIINYQKIARINNDMQGEIDF